MAAMVGHLAVPGLGDGVPTSLAPETIDGLLRGEFGFDGLVLTDSIDMGALSSYPAGEATLLALLAGADVVIVQSPGSVPPLLAELMGYVESGRLTQETVDDSVERVLDTKGVDPCSIASR